MKSIISYRRLFIGLFYVALIQGVTPVGGQAQQTEPILFDFRFAPVRAAGMADAYTSEAQSTSDMYINPASLGFISSGKRVQALMHFQIENQMQSEHLVGSLLDANPHFVGIGYVYSHRGFSNLPDPFRTATSIQLPDFQSHRMDIGYAFKVAPGFAVGSQVSSQFAHNNQYSQWTHSGALGVFYEPTDDISYAFVYRGPGTQLQYQLDGVDTKLDYAGHPHAFEIGSTFRFPTAYRHPIITLSLSNTKILNQDGIWYKIGTEIRPVHPLALRGGYITGPEYKGARVGFGVYTRYMTVDYAFAAHPNIRYRFHQLGFTINLSSNHVR